MTNPMQEAADACLSLAYQYSSLMSCVKNQRPELLADPSLSFINMQMESLTLAFDARVRQIAAGEHQ